MAQVQEVRDDGLRQGMGRQSQRLPALRPSRPHRLATRFEQLFDDAKYELLPAPEVREDPLRFRDSKRYTDRIKAARSATESGTR